MNFSFKKLKDSFNSIFSNDLAIDLGTANTLVYCRGQGIILDEPSVVAVQKDYMGPKSVVLAVGQEAKGMLGKTPGSIVAIRPIKDGVIADFEVTSAMLRYFIKKSKGKHHSFFPPKVIICVPYGITQVEKRAVKESARFAGAGDVFLIEEPMAAAIGANLPITDPAGNMVLDIGGGTSGVAVISLGGIVYCNSIKIAGDKFDESIVNYIRRQFNLLIGERTAENIKIQIGSAYPSDENRSMEVKGRDLVAGSPKTISLTANQVNEALLSPLSTIVDAVRTALEKTPPELASDIVDSGIVLTGGGALLSNLDTLITERTGLPVAVAENPLSCVVRGAGQILDNMELLKRISVEDY